MADTLGKWFADYEGTIKRTISDSEGNHTGYELLSGEYPKEWAAAPEMLEALKQTTSWLEAIYKQGLINPRSSIPNWIQKGNDAIIKAERKEAS